MGVNKEEVTYTLNGFIAAKEAGKIKKDVTVYVVTPQCEEIIVKQ